MSQYRNSILVAACLLFTSQTSAETYYASPTGGASWAQCININAPCDGRTAVENAVAGDTVYFRGGTYDPAANPVASWSSTPDNFKYEFLPWNPSNSGTPTSPITFKAYPGEKPVFLDNIYSGTIGAVGRDWIIWDGFSGTIVDSTVFTVIIFAYFQEATNCVFRNGDITGVLKDSHNNSGLISLLRTTNILIENNRLHDMNDMAGGAPNEEAVNAAAILSFNSRGLIVKNNDIYNNYLGIWDKDTEQSNRYYQNHIWGGNTYATRCRVGIQIREGVARYGAATNPQAYQNVIRNCDIGIWASYDNTAIASPKIYNNVVFYDGSLANSEVGIDVSVGASAAEIYSNIIYGYSNPLRYYAPVATRIAYSNQNNFFNLSAMSWRTGFNTPSYATLDAWTAATTFDANSILTNPLFVSAGSINPADYKLALGSPAIGAGRNGVNIGAYPLSTSPSIGFSFSSPPAVTFTAAPASVSAGAPSTLSWLSTNATSCAASGAWSGTKATSGSQVLTNLNTTSTYTLTCRGAGGSASQSATISVTPL